jgi:CRISPR-associated protein Csd2
MITKKIDFAIIMRVVNANPNGDPLNGNRPRVNYDGLGEMSDVCLKRKIRNRLLDNGQSILVQSHDYRNDKHNSIKERFDSNPVIKALGENAPSDEIIKAACKEWFDVRAFGQVLAFKGKDGKKGKKDKKSKNVNTDIDDNDDSDDINESEAGVSIPIRGPVSIQSAFSRAPVDVESLRITKSVNLETNKENPDKKNPDTMGMKHRVDKGIYVTYGSINKQLAEKTGFSDDDAIILRQAMLKMFENDESSARPAGSMEVLKVIWWTHNEDDKDDQKTFSSAKVHNSLDVRPDGTYTLTEIDKLIDVKELDGE